MHNERSVSTLWVKRNLGSEHLKGHKCNVTKRKMGQAGEFLAIQSFIAQPSILNTHIQR